MTPLLIACIGAFVSLAAILVFFALALSSIVSRMEEQAKQAEHMIDPPNLTNGRH